MRPTLASGSDVYSMLKDSDKQNQWSFKNSVIKSRNLNKSEVTNRSASTSFEQVKEDRKF